MLIAFSVTPLGVGEGLLGVAGVLFRLHDRLRQLAVPVLEGDLVGHEVVVGWPVHRAEDADRGVREVAGVEPGQRDRLIGTGRTFVVVDTVGAGQCGDELVVELSFPTSPSQIFLLER